MTYLEAFDAMQATMVLLWPQQLLQVSRTIPCCSMLCMVLIWSSVGLHNLTFDVTSDRHNVNPKCQS